MHKYLRASMAGAAVSLAALFLPERAFAQGGLLDEVRFGVYQHDTNLIGHQKETGADFSLEILSSPQRAVRSKEETGPNADFFPQYR